MQGLRVHQSPGLASSDRATTNPQFILRRLAIQICRLLTLSALAPLADLKLAVIFSRPTQEGSRRWCPFITNVENNASASALASVLRTQIQEETSICVVKILIHVVREKEERKRRRRESQNNNSLSVYINGQWSRD